MKLGLIVKMIARIIVFSFIQISGPNRLAFRCIPSFLLNEIFTRIYTAFYIYVCVYIYIYRHAHQNICLIYTSGSNTSKFYAK